MKNLFITSIVLLCCLSLSCQDKQNLKATKLKPSSSATPNTEFNKKVKRSKPAASVQLTSNPYVSLRQGQSKKLTLELKSTRTTGQLHIKLNSSPGLSIDNQTEELKLDLSQYQTLQIPIKITGNQLGRNIINIFAFINDQHTSSHRALAMIVNVRSVNNEGDVKIEKSNSNKKVVILPAAEDIVN